MTYTQFKYIQPPLVDGKRPACVVFTNGTELQVYNGEGERLALLCNYKGINFRSLAPTGNWFVYSGEYSNKVFTIWDVLVSNGRDVTTEPEKVRMMLLLFLNKTDTITVKILRITD